MAKLTDEQKAINKAHQKARDKAFNERKKAYHDALNAEMKKLSASELFKKMDKANKEFDQRLAFINQKEYEIREKIAELEAEIKNLRTVHGLDAVNEARRMTNNEYFDRRSAIEKEIEAQFSDVARIFSAVQWEQLGHFKAQCN